MNRAVAGLLLSLFVASTIADDIDIYYPRAVDNNPRRIVLLLDLASAHRQGVGEEYRSALAVIIEKLASLELRQPGWSAVEVALLAPPTQGCGSGDHCTVTDWSLGEFLRPADPSQAAQLESQVSQLLLAAENSRGEGRYSLIDAYSLLERQLELVTCETIDVVNLLLDATAWPVPTVEPGDSPWLRSHFLVSGMASGFAELADRFGAEVHSVVEVTALGDSLLPVLATPRPGPTTLLSASVPAFSAEPAEDTDDVFFPLFSPRRLAYWPGNLKKLKLVATESGVVIAQAPLARPPVPAIDPADGAIRRSALTFWTDPLGFDVQNFDPALGEVSGKDGRSVMRGGAGQAVPGYLSGTLASSNSQPGARQLFTLPHQPGQPLVPLNADLETAALLRAEIETPGADALRLLRFVRGKDEFDADADGNTLEPRPWFIGSVMHSQPAIVRYGPRDGYSTGNPDIRILFGSNDGFLRMLTDRAVDSRGWRAGREVWAVMPRELLARQASLAGLVTDGPPGYLYGVDGSPVVHRLDINRDGLIDPGEGDQVWVFFGLRRGGQGYFALDISESDNPVFMWKLSPEVAGFEQLALGFSTPRLALMDLGGGQPRRVLLFAAGYNGGIVSGVATGKDAGSEEDRIGNAVYVVDAATGELIWRATGPGAVNTVSLAGKTYSSSQMRHSIPAPVTPVDGDGDGLVDRAYVADTGGVLWRVDMPGAGAVFTGSEQDLVASWRVSPLAELGGADEHDRRFFHAVDVTRTRDALGEYDGLALVSGNRARPAEARVGNYAYLVKDRGQSGTVSHEQLTDVGERCQQTTSEECSNANLSLGWKFALQAPGEKGLSRPLIRSGMMLFSSYRPPEPQPGSCESGLGTASVYSVRLDNGSPAVRQLFRPNDDDNTEPAEEENRFFAVGDGIPGPVVPWRDWLILPGTGPEGQQVVKPRGPMRWRIYWRENGVDVP